MAINLRTEDAGSAITIAFGDGRTLKSNTKFGKTEAGAVDTNWTDVAYGTTTIEQPVYYDGNPQFVEAVSTDANDAAGGSGVQTINIQGVDEFGEWVGEDIEMNGTTPVVSVRKYYNAIRGFGTLVGSGGAQVGHILIQEVGGTGPIYLVIPPDEAQTQCVYVPVPPGWQLVVLDISVSFDSPRDGDYRLLYRQWVDTGAPYRTSGPWREVFAQAMNKDGALEVNFPGSYAFTGPGEIKLQAKLDTLAGTAFGRMGIRLKKIGS